MALGHTGKKYEQHLSPFIKLHFNFNDIGTPFYSHDVVPPCTVTRAVVTKVADFDSGTTCTIDVGFDYVDGTSDVGDAIIDGADLTSSTQLGPLQATLDDSVAATTATAAKIKVTLAETGTAATAGEGYVTIWYEPTDYLSGRSPAYA